MAKESQGKSYDPKSKDSIMRRIKALLARAASTTFPNERDLCMQQAERLMVKYSIDGDSVDTESDRYASSTTNFTATVFPSFAKEKARVLGMIAEVFNVASIRTRIPKEAYLDSYGDLRYRTTRPGEVDMHLFGHERDLDITWTLFESILVQINAEVAFLPNIPNYRKAFIVHYGIKVAERIKEYYREAVAEQPGTELVLANRLQSAEEARSQQYPNMTINKAPQSWGDMEGAIHGLIRGEDADISLFSRRVEDKDTIPELA